MNRNRWSRILLMTRKIHSSSVIRHGGSISMRAIHLLRKYDPAQWGGTETAVQRLFAGLREHDVESVVYCPSIKRTVEKDPLAVAGHRIERFNAFVPIAGISSQRKRQIVSVGGNLMSL